MIEHRATTGHPLLRNPHLIHALLSSSQYTAVYDTGQRLIAINPAALTLMHRSLDEVIGKTFSELFPAGVGLQAHQDLTRALNGEVIANEQYYSERIDRYFHNHLVPLRGADGEVIGAFLSGHEITAMVRSSKELQSLNQQLAKKNADLKIAQRLAQVGSWEWDIAANTVSWTLELYRIYGVEKDTFQPTYDSFLAAVYPDDRDRVNTIIQDAYKSHQPFDFIHRIIRPDGVIRTLNARGELVANDEGQPQIMRGTGQDITDTVESQNKMTELVHTFNFAEQTSQIGSFRIDMKNHAFSYSDNLFRLLGCEPGAFEPSAEQFFTFVHPEDLSRVKSLSRAFVDDRDNSSHEFRIIRKDGEIRHVRNKGIFLGDEQTGVYIGTMQDITWQVNKEKQLLQKNAELENMNKELASFSYIASHDLHEPLRKISMFTERILERDLEHLSSDGKLYFSKIQKSVDRMRELIDDLLSYSRTSTGTHHFERASLDQLVQEVVESLQDIMQPLGATITWEELPEATVIPFQMKQLITNLLGNSLKFSRPNVPPLIRISSGVFHNTDGTLLPNLPEGDYHEIEFTDNGIGFEQEYSEHIFGMFQRLHARNEYDGTGVGLAICKKIAENHKGSLVAEGRPGEGSTFRLYLPIK